MQEFLTAFVQIYVGIGLAFGVLMSLATRRQWHKAFVSEDFYPRPALRSYLALAGVLTFILLWPSVIVSGFKRYMRRRRGIER